jgi:hypothetical protein
MKTNSAMALFSLSFIGLLPSLVASTLVRESTPVDKVLGLLDNLKEGIVADGQQEQRSYDKSACWCESTMERKVKEIASGKKTFEELEALILKLNGETASTEAEAKNLEKLLAANLASQKEASETRGVENSGYKEDSTEYEQSVGALEAAITALTGAGTVKSSSKFLETSGGASMEEAQLLSVAAGIRPVLERSASRLSEADLRVAQQFASHPEHFLRRPKRVGEVSAVQISNNPFGDYAPQSTQIQGILKGLYDTFTGSLEKSNAAEATSQKSHEEFMTTKGDEAKVLQASLQAATTSTAELNKQLAEAEVMRDATGSELKANEAFFEETKAACKERAIEWAVRSRLRSEELQGIEKAVEILSSPEAKSIFGNATSLVQLSAIEAHGSGKHAAGIERAMKIALRAATSVGNRGRTVKLAASATALKLAIKTRSGGHFDEVIFAIDEMIGVLRKEEQEDIAHRDRCEETTNKNGNDMEDLQHAIGKANGSIERMGHRAVELGEEAIEIEEKLTATNESLAETLEMRNKEHENFVKSLKDDKAAVALLEQAIAALGSFYKQNKIAAPGASLLQRQGPDDPEYTVDKDKMPETEYSGGYEGKKGESSPVLAMLTTIKEDLEKEMVTGREDEAAAQAAFKEERADMQKSFLAQEKELVSKKTQVAEVKDKMADMSAGLTVHEAELDEQKELATDLVMDCGWVKLEFENRRAARKREMDGLSEAKDFLAGIETE